MKNLLKIGIAALAICFVMIAIADVSPAMCFMGVGIGLCTNLASIPEECGPNPAGIKPKVWIADWSKAIWPSIGADGLSITADITFPTDQGWVTVDLEIDQNEFNYNGSGDPGTQVIGQEVNAYVSRMTKERDIQTQKYLNRKLLVMIQHDGVKRILGDADRPASITYDTKSGKKGKDKKGTDLKIMVDGIAHNPYYYSGVVTLQTEA